MDNAIPTAEEVESALIRMVDGSSESDIVAFTGCPIKDAMKIYRIYGYLVKKHFG